jgi:methyl-accepting chemotaxis protein
MVILSIGLVLLVSYYTIRSISIPLAKALGLANQVAAGDLTAQIEVNSTDEFGKLLNALKTMNENLTRMVHDIRGGAESIRNAAEEVAEGNSNLSQRTEVQAATLEETASSMEELTSAVRANTQSADNANALAKEANQVAAQGGTVVSAVVATMNEIQESSMKIGDIISVIDSIAFQTNILALNAAVEAATEVRALARRSADAAKEIKTLIGNSVEKVEAGTRQVENAGKTMSEIVASVEKVTTIIDQISSASRQQADGIEQVNRAVGQMDQVVQQNAAVVEQAAAAAESMQGNAQQLVQSVSVFKLNGMVAAQPAAYKHTRRAQPATPAPAPAAKPRLAGQTRRSIAPLKVSAEARSGTLQPDTGYKEWKEF